MAIRAARRASRMGGGFRAWLFGKALDQSEPGREGTGKVTREALRAYVIGLGVGDRTARRWMNEARTNDFISDYQDKGGQWWVILHSAARVARVMDLEAVGNKVTMQAGELIGTGWKARVYAGWEHGKQITCEQIQKATNVPVSTQRYRRNQAGTKRQRNYAKSNLKADSFAGVIEHRNYKAPYVMRDGFIAWRLPDMRTSEHIERISKGRSRKINTAIRNGSGTGLSQMRRAFTDGGRREIVRLFNLTDAQRRQAERKINRQDLRIYDIYQRTETAKSGAVIWKHHPVMGQGMK